MDMQCNFREESAQEALRAMLRKMPLAITFTKVDGTERTLRCSLDSRLYTFEGKRRKGMEDEPFAEDVAAERAAKVLVIIDMDSESWKSIRWGSIKDVRTIGQVNPCADLVFNTDKAFSNGIIANNIA